MENYDAYFIASSTEAPVASHSKIISTLILDPEMIGLPLRIEVFDVIK
ncbi:MAG: hypothetical protein ABIN97_09765 [Ginsengibacter sp.]